jgi:hypothetical protein
MVKGFFKKLFIFLSKHQGLFGKTLEAFPKKCMEELAKQLLP